MQEKGFLISEDVKERILELLSTRDAATTALLSSHWNHVWLRHGRLVFDKDFFQCVSSKGKADKAIDLVNIINNILLLRDGPIKKFALHMNNRDLKPQQIDLDRWCHFLSRNGVQELTLLAVCGEYKLPSSIVSCPTIELLAVCGEYKLPSSIVSCPTIEQLILNGFILDLPINACCIFPSVTSLVLDGVEFGNNVHEIVYSIPNIEKVTFHFCDGFSDFEFSAPNLKRLTVNESISEVGSRCFWLHSKAIMTLCMYCEFLKYEDAVATLTFPTSATNVQVMKLYEFSFSREELWVTMQFLQKSPKLCELGIIISNVIKCRLDIEAGSRLLEYPKGYIANQDLELLNTIKIESFGGSTLELLFVKLLLSRSPAIESVIIQEHYDNDAMAVKVHRELLCFPRASPKAKIICMDQKHMNNLVCFPKF